MTSGNMQSDPKQELTSDNTSVLHSYDQFERRIDRTNCLIVVVAVAFTLALHSVKGAFSLTAGGALSYLNFHWLKQVINDLILKGGKGPIGRRVVLQYSGRYALIGLALYVTIRFTFLELSLFLVGLFSYVLALLLESLFEIGRSLFRVNQNGRT